MGYLFTTFVCAVFSMLLGLVSGAYLFAILSLLIFLTFSLALFKWKINCFVVLLPFLFGRLTNIASLCIIEAGAYMKEISSTGSYINATTSYVVVTMLFLVAASIAASFMMRFGGSETSGTLPVKLPILICIVTIFYMVLFGLRVGFPLLEGVDRFVFKRDSADYIYRFLLGNRFLYSVVLGCFVAFSEWRIKAITIGIFVVFILVLVLFGEKFFSILNSVLYFSIPIMMASVARGANFTRPAIAFVVTLVFCLFVTLYIYTDYGAIPIDIALTAVLSRFASQGQLWYAALAFSPSSIPWDQLSGFLAAFASPSPDDYAFRDSYGMFYLMSIFTAGSRLEGLMEARGFVTYTMGSEAYLYLVFGSFFGLASFVAFGFVYGAAGGYLRNAIVRGDLIGIVLAIKFISYCADAINQVTFWNPLGLRGILVVLLIFLYETLRNLSLERRTV